MTEINHFKVSVLFSGDMAIIGQLSWIACISRELIKIDLFI
jgi:hypothetical protein